MKETICAKNLWKKFSAKDKTIVQKACTFLDLLVLAQKLNLRPFQFSVFCFFFPLVCHSVQMMSLPVRGRA